MVAAVLFHFAVQRRLANASGPEGGSVRASGVLGLAVWLGLALAGCAFILLE